MSSFSHELSRSTLLVSNTRQDLRLILHSSYREWKWSRLMDRISSSFLFLLALIGFFGFSPSSSFATGETRTFIITAYYSPLPDQSYYFKGNYEAEKRLNGNGTHGASGKPVFVGMLAAPKNYPFGTKIYFPGLGMGIVEDRGGAIVQAGERNQVYDRIDIWMGTGEAGLKRALLWGRREVTGTIVSGGYAMIDLSQIDTGKISLPKPKSIQNTSNTDALITSELTLLGYESYGSLRDMITAFQIDQKIISSPSDVGAGVYGPKTQAKLQELYSQYLRMRAIEEASIQASQKELLSARDLWQSRESQISSVISQGKIPKLGEKGASIRTLQVALRDLGYFSGADTGIMGTKTHKALRLYIQDRGKI